MPCRKYCNAIKEVAQVVAISIQLVQILESHVLFSVSLVIYMTQPSAFPSTHARHTSQPAPHVSLGQ